MIRRDLATVLRARARRWPVVTVVGPRQSGKTTLCRAAFPRRAYVNFAAVGERETFRADPRGFLAAHRDGAVLDEVQNVPEILGHLQSEVDERPRPGRFVLTGSNQLALGGGVAQSLAGRSAVLRLMPPTWHEVLRFPDPPAGLAEALVAGAFPRIHDRGIAAPEWYESYVTTYVERDVRQVLDVGNLRAFASFLRLCAGRTGQELNLAALASDVGVTYPTIRSWISVLEATFLVVLVPPWIRNVRRRLVKAPKLHWTDSGLVCHLLGIRDPATLRSHPLRGAIFESWVFSEIWKSCLHRGLAPELHHVRETRGDEVDLVVPDGRHVTLVEAKSGESVAADAITALRRVAESTRDAGDAEPVASVIVHGGGTRRLGGDVGLLPWSRVSRHPWMRSIPRR